MSDSSFGPFVLGGNVFGWTVQQDEAFRVLDAFVERGGTWIDTADVYSNWAPGAHGGESERILGAWMRARGNRDRVRIATKVAKWNKHPGLSADNLRAAISGSLERLQTDYVDLYYAHEDDPKVEQSEYVLAFDALVREGRVRRLGASNFEAGRLHAAIAFARERGLSGFEVSQDCWNLVEREVEQKLLPTLQREGLVELPYYALASGFLTGKYRPGRTADSPRASGSLRYLQRPDAAPLLAKLDELAATHQTSVPAIALAWLRAQPTVGAPIASARNEEQLAPLFDSASVTLGADEVRALSAITAR